MLRTEVDCWLASADEMGSAHLVPLSVPSTMRSRTVFGI
jgi:hypothetical protein